MTIRGKCQRRALVHSADSIFVRNQCNCALTWPCMIAMGQKRAFAPQKVMSALRPKADMCGAARDVRFGPIANIRGASTCPIPVRCQPNNPPPQIMSTASAWARSATSDVFLQGEYSHSAAAPRKSLVDRTNCSVGPMEFSSGVSSAIRSRGPRSTISRRISGRE